MNISFPILKKFYEEVSDFNQFFISKEFKGASKSFKYPGVYSRRTASNLDKTKKEKSWIISLQKCVQDPNYKRIKKISGEDKPFYKILVKREEEEGEEESILTEDKPSRISSCEKGISKSYSYLLGRAISNWRIIHALNGCCLPCPLYPSQGLLDLLDFLLKTAIQVITSSNKAIPPKTAITVM